MAQGCRWGRGRKERNEAGKRKLFSVVFNTSFLQKVGLEDCVLNCLYCNQYKSSGMFIFLSPQYCKPRTMLLKVSFSFSSVLVLNYIFFQAQIYTACWRYTVGKKDAVVFWNRSKVLAREQKYELHFEPRYTACCNQQCYKCAECSAFHKIDVEYIQGFSLQFTSYVWL